MVSIVAEVLDLSVEEELLEAFRDHLGSVSDSEYDGRKTSITTCKDRTTMSSAILFGQRNLSQRYSHTQLRKALETLCEKDVILKVRRDTYKPNMASMIFCASVVEPFVSNSTSAQNSTSSAAQRDEIDSVPIQKPKRRALRTISENALKVHSLESPAYSSLPLKGKRTLEAAASQSVGSKASRLETIEEGQPETNPTESESGMSLAGHINKYGRMHNCKLLRKHQMQANKKDN